MASVNRRLICAIFDALQIHTSSSLRSSLVALPDSENMGNAVEMSLISACIQTETYFIPYLLPVMTAIFDFQHTQTSVRILTSLFVLPDPNNMGIEVEFGFYLT